MSLRQIVLPGVLLSLFLLLAGCTEQPWNSPYPASEQHANILYQSFSERPKHLDPARSYSSSEWTFIEQIYEAPLQYHFLKRPYEIIPRTATAVPEPRYLDAEGRDLPDNAPLSAIAYSVYDIEIQSGIRYQPHPAFARDTEGRFRYHALTPQQLEDIASLDDLAETGARELTAADYVYQIKRFAHPAIHSPVFGLMSEYIVGLRELAGELKQAYQAQKQQAGDEAVYLDLNAWSLDGVEVVDRYRYRIRIKGLYPQFKYWLAMPFFAPMPWEADRFYSQTGLIEKNIVLDWYPVGTGPFLLSVNNPNREMVLARNPNFHGENYPDEGMPEDLAAGYLEDAGKPMPFLDKVVFKLEKESIPYWNKFLQGYYDTSGVSSDAFDQAVQMGSGGEVSLTEEMRDKDIQLNTAVATSIMYAGFNMLDPVVGGDGERARKLRQAISIAVDYEEFISIFLNGRGLTAYGPLPPGIFGYRDGEAGINPYVFDWTERGPRRKSLDEARKLLIEAGYPGGRDAETGKPLVLYFDVTGGGPDSKAMLDWWRKQLAKIDVQLVIRESDYNRFQDKMNSGTAQLFMWGWNADYPDPENFFFLLYGENTKVRHHGENAANYSNPEFDALFEKMKNMPNSAERQVLIDRMLEIVRRDSPWLWGFYPKQFSLFHGWYRNAKPNLMSRNTLKYKRIDTELRAEKRREWNKPVLWPLGLVVLVLVLLIWPAVQGYRRRERAVARGGQSA